MSQFQAPGLSHTFGGGLSETSLHPVYILILAAVVVLLFTLPRTHLIVPFTAGVFLIPLGQQVYVLGVHWLACRIIVLAGLVRLIVLRGSLKYGAHAFNVIDRVLVGCVVYQAMAFILLYLNTAALINQIGFLIDYLAAYFVIRLMIYDETDVYRTLKCLALVTAVVAAGMVWEQVTRQNLFGLLGGTAASAEVREGKIRSQGVFQHALTAGAFGATAMPLFLLLWNNGGAKAMAAVGLAGCTIMTLCSQSSTPLLGWAAGALGVCLWPIRKHMRLIRRALVATLLALHLTMKAPVWFIIARIDLTGSSSGYHRAELVDQFVRHFTDWWLVGTGSAGSWGWDLWDQQNQFVWVGETGGLVSLVLFIITIKEAFGRVGSGRQRLERTKGESRAWILGAALFSNIVCFFGVNYYDQVKFSWLILLAIIVAASQGAPAPMASEREREPTVR